MALEFTVSISTPAGEPFSVVVSLDDFPVRLRDEFAKSRHGVGHVHLLLANKELENGKSLALQGVAAGALVYAVRDHTITYRGKEVAKFRISIDTMFPSSNYNSMDGYSVRCHYTR